MTNDTQRVKEILATVMPQITQMEVYTALPRNSVRSGTERDFSTADGRRESACRKALS
jgi:hypothetical protein